MVLFQLLPSLFLGDQSVGCSKEDLIEFNITRLVAIKVVEQFQSLHPRVFKYISFDVYDSSEDLVGYFEQTFEFIRKNFVVKRSLIFISENARN